MKRQVKRPKGQERYDAAPSRVRGVVEAVSIATQISAEDIMGDVRKRPIVNARFMAMARLRETRFNFGKPSLAQIGGWFGRDHTSVINALRRVGARDVRDAGIHHLVRMVADETDRLCA